MRIMKTPTRPIRSTIIWALVSGLLYIPLGSVLNRLLSWPLGFQLSLWALLAGYAVLLTRWASRPPKAIGLPLLLLFGSAFLIHSTTAFLYTALATLSWVRSAICFSERPLAKRLVSELGLGVTTAMLMSGTVPGLTPVSALGLWLFFLTQALYFVLFDYQGDQPIKIEVDPFEKAKMAVENILSGENF